MLKLHDAKSKLHHYNQTQLLFCLSNKQQKKTIVQFLPKNWTTLSFFTCWQYTEADLALDIDLNTHP